jgi:hypothetical protein
MRERMHELKEMILHPFHYEAMRHGMGFAGTQEEKRPGETGYKIDESSGSE